MSESDALRRVLGELGQAEDSFPKFNSPHEGYAVLLEEVDELWEMVRAKPSFLRDDAMRAEATQVAAMAIRFLKDCC